MEYQGGRSLSAKYPDMCTTRRTLPDVKMSLVWACVVLVLGILAGVVVLVLLHADLTAYLGLVNMLALPLLGAGGVYIAGQLQGIKEQTNGTMTSLVNTVKEHSRMLAAAHVPASALPAPAVPETAPSASVPPDQAPAP